LAGSGSNHANPWNDVELDRPHSRKRRGPRDDDDGHQTKRKRPQRGVQTSTDTSDDER